MAATPIDRLPFLVAAVSLTDLNRRIPVLLMTFAIVDVSLYVVDHDLLRARFSGPFQENLVTTQNITGPDFSV